MAAAEELVVISYPQLKVKQRDHCTVDDDFFRGRSSLTLGSRVMVLFTQLTLTVSMFHEFCMCRMTSPDQALQV